METVRTPDSLPLLGIGIAVGGLDATNRDVYEAISAFQKRVVVERRGFDEAGVHLNLNFEIPGPLVAPEPRGVRLSRFDRERGWAIVSCSVPISLEAAAVDSFVVRTLRESLTKVQDAAERSKQRGVPWECASLERLVNHLTATGFERQVTLPDTD
jgi:hypothetical protein